MALVWPPIDFITFCRYLICSSGSAALSAATGIAREAARTRVWATRVFIMVSMLLFRRRRKQLRTVIRQFARRKMPFGLPKLNVDRSRPDLITASRRVVVGGIRFGVRDDL